MVQYAGPDWQEAKQLVTPPADIDVNHLPSDIFDHGASTVQTRSYRPYIAHDQAFPRRLCTWGSNVSLT